MTETARNFAETTENTDISSVIAEMLQSLDIRGSVLLREPYVSPWSVSIPDAERLAVALGKSQSVRVVAFHLVEYGHCCIRTGNGEEQVLKAGEMAVCFGGEQHLLFHGEAENTQSIESLLLGGANASRPVADATAGDTVLLCGVFVLSHTEFNPLVSALPALMVSKLSRSGELHNLSGVARLMAEEIDRKSIGSEYIVDRLLEVLCAEIIRAHIENTPQQQTGWLCAIHDPLIARVIAAIHSRPGDAWSVPRMAQTVSMSPSRFAARFSASIGIGPMAYLSRWRMHVACRLLASSQKTVEQIAMETGYDSVAAFSRAFKKHLKLPPAAWRARSKAQQTVGQ